MTSSIYSLANANLLISVYAFIKLPSTKLTMYVIKYMYYFIHFAHNYSRIFFMSLFLLCNTDITYKLYCYFYPIIAKGKSSQKDTALTPLLFCKLLLYILHHIIIDPVLLQWISSQSEVLPSMCHPQSSAEA